MKKILYGTTLVILVLTLLFTLVSCNDDKDDPSLISTTPDTTTAPPDITEHEHTYVTTVTDPTCTEGGFTTYLCDCGETYDDDLTEALGHDFGDWVTQKAATCTATGVERRTCSRCDVFEEREIPISAHQYVETVIAPTNTTQGYTKHVCSVCGDSYNDSYTNPTGSTGLSFTTNSDDSITITGIGTCTDEDIIIYSTYYVDSNGTSKIVSGIAANAFRDNAKIKTIAIPASVTTIGDGAFAGCTKLTGFTVEGENKNYSVSGEMLCSKDGSTIIAFPAGLTLSTFTISTTFTSINPSAFAGCIYLTAFEVAAANNKFAVQDGILYNGDKTTLIAYPAGKALNLLTIPDTVEEIGDYAFYKATKLNAVTLPDRTYAADTTTVDVSGVASIGSYAFYGCTNLTSIVIPNITASVKTYAFANCTKLEDITIGAGLKTISTHAFENCTSLVDLTIPATVEVIDEYAFYNCTKLTTLIIGVGVQEIGEKAFTGCLNQGKDTDGENIARVYYEGSSNKWNGSTISVDPSNTMYLTMYADIYFYSETNPGAGNYWHYVGDVPTAY